MKIWIIQDGEPIPGIDEGARPWRAAMLAEALVSRGHEVLWWASTFDHFQKRHRFPQAQTVNISPSLSIRFLPGPGYRSNKSPLRWIHHRVTAREFAREARLLSPPDLIFASLPTLELAEQAVIFGKKFNIPVFVDVRDLWPDHYLTLFPQILESTVRRLLAYEFNRVRRILSGATGIIALTERFLQWGLDYASREKREQDGVFHIGYPILSSPYHQVVEIQRKLMSKYGLKTSCPIISFAGSLNSLFAFDTVIHAARALNSLQVDIQFVIAGDGPQLPRLLKLSSGLENVMFIGWIDRLPLSALLQLSDIGLAPYISGDSAIGHLTNKVFEYMAYGLPLLSSLSGELEGLLAREKIGLHYQANDVQDLIAKIIWLVEHPEKRVVMGQRARKLFDKQFRAEIIYPKLAEHLEKCVVEWNSTRQRVT